MTSKPDMRTIEINGVKLEVDMRYAKRIDDLRVGDRVKVLKKVYSDYKIYPGTIIGFEPFEKLPTIIIAYVDKEYSETNIKFLYYNGASTDVEIVKALDGDFLGLEKSDVVSALNNAIEKKELEADELKRKKAFFLENFNRYWADVDEAIALMERQSGEKK
jgi:hypothetical protein